MRADNWPTRSVCDREVGGDQSNVIEERIPAVQDQTHLIVRVNGCGVERAGLYAAAVGQNCSGCIHRATGLMVVNACSPEVTSSGGYPLSASTVPRDGDTLTSVAVIQLPGPRGR